MICLVELLPVRSRRRRRDLPGPRAIGSRSSCHDGSDAAEVLYAITTAGITQLNVSDRLTRAGTASILENSGTPRVIVTRRSERGPIAVFATVREVQGPRLLCQVDHLPRNAIAKVAKAALSQQLGRLRSPARRRADMAAEFRQEEDANAVEAR
jgi:hypothetical protein